MRARSRAWVGVFGGLAVVLGLATWTTTKEFVAPCTVWVTGKAGSPQPNIRVSEHWDAYSYDLSGGMETLTNGDGIATFPEQSSKHSVLFWIASPVLTRLNYGVHASTGVVASINVPEPTADDGKVGSLTCTNADCSNHPLEFRIQLANR